MPLGFPVVPEVYITVATSVAFTAAARSARAASSNSAPWLTICSRESTPCRSAAAAENTTTSFRCGSAERDGRTFDTCSSSEASRIRAPQWRSM